MASLLSRLIRQSRYLAGIAVVGLLLASVSLYLMGLHLVLNELGWAIKGQTLQIASFQMHILEAVDHFLVGTGCLSLAIGIYSLFVEALHLPDSMQVNSFHAVKTTFANFLILAMAVGFLRALGRMELKVQSWPGSGSPLLFAGAGIVLVTGSLLAFRHFGGQLDLPAKDGEPGKS